MRYSINFHWSLLAAALCSFFGFVQVVSAGPPRIIDIGAEMAQPAAINNRGDVAGSNYVFSRQRGLSILPLSPPFSSHRTAIIESINDQGDVAGENFSDIDQPCPGITEFGFVNNPTVALDYSFLKSISNNGNLAGACDLVCAGGNGSNFNACTTVNGVRRKLSELRGYASAINDAGQAVVNVTSEDFHLFRSSADGTLTEILSSPGGFGVQGNGINSAGTVIGHVQTAQAVRGFLARVGEAPAYIDSLVANVPSSIEPSAINDLEQVVGTSPTGSSFFPHTFPFLFTPGGGFQKLNELLPNDTAYQLVDATGINNSGEITGRMAVGIEPHGYILTTQPNSALDKSFTENRATNRAVFRPSEGNWYIEGSPQPIIRHWGLPGDVPVRGDFDHDGVLDLVVYRPSTATWWICPSNGGFSCVNGYGVQFGLRGDLPLSGDFDGDGISDLVVYRAFYSVGTGRKKVSIEGQWYIRSANGTMTTVQWGLRDDLPTPEDYDGDGKTDIAVYRPSNGTWYILYSSKNYSKAAADIGVYQFGLLDDHPMPADYDGDGRADLGVWRPSTGEWYRCSSILNFDCSGTAGLQPRFAQTQFGLTSDTPVRGDFDGDETFDLALWRENFGGYVGTWFSHSEARTSALSKQWGLPGDLPTGLGVRRLRKLIPRNVNR